LFSPFGSIEYIEVPKNKEGKAEGIAYVQFKKTKDAKEAIKKMNGFKFKGKLLKVASANEGLKPSRAGEHVPTTELEAEEKGKLIEGVEARATLSKKLIRDDNLPAHLFSTPQAINAANVSAATLVEYGVGNEPSHCLILTNLFDPATVDLTKEPTFFLDVKDDVIGYYLF
jgi:RNA-binding protein 39